MKKTINYLLASIVLALLFGFQIDKNEDDDPAGKKIFIANKCATCHSVESADIVLKKKKGNIPDLSDVGTKFDSEFMKKWILKEETIDGVKHMHTYKGSDEDLITLVEWLMSLSQQEAADSTETIESKNEAVQDSVDIQ